MWSFFTKRKILTRFIATLLITAFIAAPISHKGEVKEADAQLAVKIAADIGDLTDIYNWLVNSYTGIEQGWTDWNTFGTWILDQVLDPLFWMIVEGIITGILEDMIMWVNSGFEGDPQFITNFERYLTDVADEAAGEFIYGSELGFLCDPFELDIRIALSIQYASEMREFQPQCTLTEIGENFDQFINGTFVDGGWKSWFEFTQGRYSSRVSSFSRAQEQLEREVAEARNRRGQEAAANRFWLGVEICGFDSVSVISSEDTQPNEACETGTPGSVVDTQINNWLGVPAGRLTIADEIDELIGALLAQLGNQLMMGVNGLLGMGGSDYYTDYNFGGRGDSSYLSALRAQSNSGGNNPAAGPGAISRIILAQRDYLKFQENIVDEVEEVEKALEKGEADYPGCFSLDLDEDLAEAKEDAEAEVVKTEQNIAELEQFITNYATATPQEAVSIINQAMGGVNNGRYVQSSASLNADIYTRTEFTPLKESAEAAIASERQRCQELEDERRRQEERGSQSSGNTGSNNNGNDR